MGQNYEKLFQQCTRLNRYQLRWSRSSQLVVLPKQKPTVKSIGENNKKIEAVFVHFIFISIIAGGIVVIIYRALHDLEVTFRRDIVPLLILGSVYPMVIFGIRYQGTAIGDGTARNVESKTNTIFPRGKDESK